MPAWLRERARQIEARISHRRAIKMAIAGTMRLGAEGIKINIAGRVNGAEIARARATKKDVFLCTPSVLTSTTRWLSAHHLRPHRHQVLDLPR